MVLAQKQKYHSMEQGKKPPQNPHTYGPLNFDKGGIYNGEKKISLTSGAGKLVNHL